MQRIFTWIFAAALLLSGGSWIYAQTVPTGTNTTQGSGGGGPAWRRALAQNAPGALLNRESPSEDELAIILAMSI